MNKSYINLRINNTNNIEMLLVIFFLSNYRILFSELWGKKACIANWKCILRIVREERNKKRIDEHLKISDSPPPPLFFLAPSFRTFFLSAKSLQTRWRPFKRNAKVKSRQRFWNDSSPEETIYGISRKQCCETSFDKLDIVDFFFVKDL